MILDKVKTGPRKSMIYRVLLFLTFFTILLFGSWEIGASEFKPETASKQIKVLILGDSLTEGYGIDKNDAYPSILQKKLSEKKFNVNIVNSGISGSTSASAPKRVKWHLRKKPDVLLLVLGGNDGLRGVKTESMFNNLDRTIKMAKEAGVTVMIAQMMIPMNYGADYRASFEKVYRDLEKKHSIIRVPFILDGVAAIKEMNLPDGIHPNEKGHLRIADNIYPHLEKALKEIKK
jgi:acyl-CoA thioesterase-1